MSKPRRQVRRRATKKRPPRWQAEVDDFRRKLERLAPPKPLYVYDVDPAFRSLGDQHAAPRAPQAPAPRRGRMKLTLAVWNELTRRHPIDKIGSNGKLIGAPTLTKLLKIEQGITVDRATVTRRLQLTRRPPIAGA